MAVGLGKLLGFEFPQNFDSPYKATDASDFWRRWHMTLSAWLRDYLYISLGGSRGGAARTVRNLVLTMFLGGLWHGAQWTFVVWGLYHGALLAIAHTWKRSGPGALPVWPARLLTFAAVQVGWVFFRAPTLTEAWQVLEGMAGLRGLNWVGLLQSASLLWDCLWALCICWFLPNSWELRYGTSRRWAIAFGLLAALCVSLLRRPSPFLYFQF
jgi:alginate O-acetyltransferase complex protein AlgI